MHTADREAWSAVDHDEREIDFPIWSGHPDSADYVEVRGSVDAAAAARRVLAAGRSDHCRATQACLTSAV